MRPLNAADTTSHLPPPLHSARVYKATYRGEAVAAKVLDIGRSPADQHAFLTGAALPCGRVRLQAAGWQAGRPAGRLKQRTACTACAGSS